jgi:hypothetical protein
MNKIPTSARQVLKQVEFFEWMKRETPDVFMSVVEMIEQRPERDL